MYLVSHETKGACVEAIVHSGIGNWFYIAVEVALLALATNRSLVLPDVFHTAFRLPSSIGRPQTSGRVCTPVRDMQVVSGSREMRIRSIHSAHRMRENGDDFRALSFAKVRARMFRHVLGQPVLASHHPRFGTAIHLRTVSDVHCHTYTDIRTCPRVCFRKSALKCIAMTLHLPRPILVLSDALVAAEHMKRLLPTAGVYDESSFVNATDHSGLSYSASQNALRLWIAFARARVRIASSVSTFSKSALLAMPNPSYDYIVDMRCRKSHLSDGDLFDCKRSALKDLV